MAPRSGRARGRGRTGSQRAASSQRGRGNGAATGKEIEDGVPAIFREMLSEEAGPSVVEDRPLKRRKVKDATPRRLRPPATTKPGSGESAATSELKSSPQILTRLQTVTDESESSESELEWEDVALEPEQPSSPVQVQSDQSDKPLNIVISLQEISVKRARTSRKPITSAEKSMRLDVHKMHVMYLIYHGFYRNQWCNDLKAQMILKRLVNSRLITMLNPSPNASQSQRASIFQEALKQVCDLWYIKFGITASGLSRPKWITNKDDIGRFKLSEKAEKPMDRYDFRKAAETLDGSADLSAQLFCCLLRAVGVEARLVFSLQPLSFNSSAEPAPTRTPASGKTILYADSTDEEAETNPKVERSIEVPSPAARIGGPTLTPQRIRRFGKSTGGPSVPVDLGKPPPGLTPNKAIKVQRPLHPIFWVEAFNPAYQKWVVVDAVATKTVGKPSRLEPALNDQRNCLTYAIAYEEDGHAKDVTCRYARAYNAKTRKLRVESTDGGKKWLKKALKLFGRYALLDRDQLENSELAAKEASEGMPRNVQDFKNHPYYALERHLRHNEIIHPKQEAGRLNIGTSTSARFETVYRRKDVHIIRSADKWFRLGRDVRAGERPLKYALPRRGRREHSVESDADEAGIGQYAYFQTELYIPPQVVNGRIPKNAFGNLDVYVPTMVPPGAVHIRSPTAKNAARLINVDYAEAVTGFQFKGRHGTAVIQGIIVATEYEDAIRSVLDGFAYVQAEALEEERSVEALRLWRRFLVGLRVVERLRGYRNTDEASADDRLADEELQRQIEQEMEEYGEFEPPEDSGGGFFVDQDDDEPAVPTRRSYRDEADGEDEDNYSGDGGFLPDADDIDLEEEILPPKSNSLFGLEHFELPRVTPRVEEDEGGGFLPDAGDIDSGGGFLSEVDHDGPPSVKNLALEDARQALPTIHQAQDSPTAITEMTVLSKAVMVDSQSSSEQLKLPDGKISRAVEEMGELLGSSEPKVFAQASNAIIAESTSSFQPSTAQPPEDSQPSQLDTSERANQTSQVESYKLDSSEEDSLPLEDPEDEDAEPEWLL